MSGFVAESPRFISVTSIEAAVAALSDHTGARIIAGGTDLMVEFRDRRLLPPCLVDITRIRELATIQAGRDGMRIGATATISDITSNTLVRARYPALVDAGTLLGGWQIQNRATLVGNICNGSPAAEMACPLLVLAAQVEIQGPAGSRLVPFERFLLGPGRTALGGSELVTSVILPVPREAARSAYKRVQIRHSVDIAIVSAAASLELAGGRVQGARLAFGAVAPTPMRVPDAERYLQDRELSDGVLSYVSTLATAAVRPITDSRASAEYRRAMTGVLARRVIDETAARSRAATGVCVRPGDRPGGIHD